MSHFVILPGTNIRHIIGSMICFKIGNLTFGMKKLCSMLVSGFINVLSYVRFGKVTNKNDFLCSIITWKSVQFSKMSRKCLLFFIFAGNTRTVVSWETSEAGPKKLCTVHQSKSHASPGNKWASDMIRHTEVSQVGFIRTTGGKGTTLRLYIFRPCLHVTFFF